jgi:hypothetical protein
MIFSQISNVDGDEDVTAWTDYYFTQCNGCKSVTLLKEYRFSVHLGDGPRLPIEIIRKKIENRP